MTKRRIAPAGGVGGWFNPIPSEWQKMELAFGAGLPQSARAIIVESVASYTEAAEREASSRGVEDIAQALHRARDRAEALRGDLLALGEESPVTDAIEEHMTPRSVEDLRSYAFHFIVAADAATARFGEVADVKRGDAWKAMVGQIADAFSSMGLRKTVSYQETSNKASGFVRLMIEINEMMRPRYRKGLHRDQLPAWTQGVKEAVRHWKKKPTVA